MAAGSPTLNLGEEELSSFDRNIAFTVSVEVDNIHPRRTQHHFYGAFHVAKRLAFGRPMMRRGVGFDTDQAWRQPEQDPRAVVWPAAGNRIFQS
jgi:hypothetical protein